VALSRTTDGEISEYRYSDATSRLAVHCTPVVLVVGAASGESPLRTAENRDATAAGIQNLLLGATTTGLATYWSSCPKGANDVVARWCGFPEGTHVTALIYVGWASREVAAPERPGPTIIYRS